MNAVNALLIQPWPYLAVAALAAVTGWYAWKQPHRPGTRYFRWLAGVWLACELTVALQTVFQAEEARYILWVAFCSLTLLSAPLDLMVVLEYIGSEKWLARRGLHLLFLPALLWGVAGLMMPSQFNVIEYHFGYPVILALGLVRLGFYSYISILFLIRIAVLFASLVRASAFRVPILLLILSQTVPIAVYAAIDPRQLAVSPIQVTIVSFGFSILAYCVVLYVFRFLQVIPVARNQVIAHIPYSLIVLDAENRLVDFNAAARALPGLPDKMPLRQAASRALAGWWDRLAPMVGLQPISQDMVVPSGHGTRIFRVVSLPLLQAGGWRMGQVFLLEDVTAARQEQQMLATLHEREFLARELHDSIGQVLSFASIKVAAARKLLADGKLATADDQLAHLESLVAEAHADVREYILNLRTAPIAEKPFFAALRQYLEGFRQNYAIQVNLSIGPGVDEGVFAPGVQIQLFRILQQAFSNARKHAETDCVRVSFEREDSLVRIRVEDQGKGFDLQQAAGAAGGHFGLRFMRERAEQVGGSLRVESVPGKGTCVEVIVPVTGCGETGREADGK